MLNTDFPELFAVIGYTYGGNVDNNEFNLPDYQGLFLRGADPDGAADPNAKLRRGLHPENVMAGTTIGTFQEYATKKPNGAGFKGNFSHLPKDSKGTHGVTKNNNTGYDGSSTYLQSTCTSGGDKESRPKNVYVNYYIKVRG